MPTEIKTTGFNKWFNGTDVIADKSGQHGAVSCVEIAQQEIGMEDYDVTACMRS